MAEAAATTTSLGVEGLAGKDGSASEALQKDKDQINWEDLDPVKFLMTGSMVSVSCDMLLFPFDLIKTRMQVQGSVSTIPLSQMRCYYSGSKNSNLLRYLVQF